MAIHEGFEGMALADRHIALYNEISRDSGICQSRTFAALLLPKLMSDELRVEDAKQIIGRCV